MSRRNHTTPGGVGLSKKLEEVPPIHYKGKQYNPKYDADGWAIPFPKDKNGNSIPYATKPKNIVEKIIKKEEDDTE